MRIALALLGVLAASPAHAECARFGLDPVIVTTAGAKLPPTGGILVRAEATRTGGYGPGDVAVQPGWHYKGKPGKPVIATIAPGLAVMRVPDGPVELLDDAGKSLIAVTGSTTTTTALPAPKVKAVEIITRDLGYRGTADNITVALDGPIPGGMVALVLLDAKTKKPRSFGLIADATAPVTVYAVGRCKPQPNGTLASKAGDSVAVMYVDATGRISSPSPPVTLKTAPTPKP